MTKKTILGLIGVILILGAALYAYKNQPHGTVIKYKNMNAYFIKTDIPLEEDNLNYFIIENQEEMDAVLGIAKTMTNDVDFPDFSKDMVIAIAYPATNYDSKITLNYVKYISESIYIDYSFDQGEERGFSIIPAKIITFAKPKKVLDLYFSEDENIDRKIAMGRRTLGSPISIDDLMQNYTGIYMGTLPCADCSGIETTLNLHPDNRYEMLETYTGKTTIPVKTEGSWEASDDLALIHLENIGISFFIDDSTTIERADTEGKRINSELNYKLIKEQN